MSRAKASPRGVIEPASWPADAALARTLFLEYADWLELDLCFQGFEAELAGLPGAYAPPGGNLWFARVAGAPAGVVALRPFGNDDRHADRDEIRPGRCCEMKRLWVRPAYRGLGLGRRLAELTLMAAEQMGYRRMVLDTVHDMTEARALYASLGFRDRTEQVGDRHPALVYLECDLTRDRLQNPDAPTGGPR